MAGEHDGSCIKGLEIVVILNSTSIAVLLRASVENLRPGVRPAVLCVPSFIVQAEQRILATVHSFA